jgi:hypothetical protein
LPTDVITIERKKYAAGLLWQPVAAGQNPRAYARHLARTIGKKLNLFIEYRNMIGLGSRKTGHSGGMPVAAAEAVEAFAEFSSLLAVFQVNNGYWLFAARNGIILEDRLFSDEAAAKDFYSKLSQMPDWGAMFAPGSWAAPRAVEKHLEDVISGGAKATLKPISHFKSDFFALVLFLVFALSVAHFFKEPIAKIISPAPRVSALDPNAAEEYKKRLVEKNQELNVKLNIQQKAPPAPAPLAMPYDNIPETGARAQLCYQAVGFLMQPVPGWVQTGAECLDATAAATFRRSFGNLGDFYEIATDLFPGAIVREESDSVIILTANLPALPAYASVSELDAESLGREISTRFQRIDSDVNINAVVDTVENGKESANINVLEVAAASKLAPIEFMKIFDDIEGVYLSRAHWDAKSRTWNYEVIVYAE